MNTVQRAQEELATYFRRRFPVLDHILFSNESASRNYPIPLVFGYFLAAGESDPGNDCCFVLPSAQDSAFMMSILLFISSHMNLSNKFVESYLENALHNGDRVRLLPDGGVYFYRGRHPESSDKVILEVEVKGNACTVTFPVKQVLRLEPTARKTPKGKLSLYPDKYTESLCPMDKLLDTETFGNTSIFKNNVLLLSELSAWEAFIEETRLIRNGHSESSMPVIGEYLPWARIRDDGSFEMNDRFQTYGEPAVAVSHRVENITEACRRADKDCLTVVVDGTQKLTRNIQAYDEILERQKLVVITDYTRQNQVSLMTERGCTTWYLNPNERQLDIAVSDRKGIDSGTQFSSAMSNFGSLSIRTEQCQDYLLELAARHLDTASRSQRQEVPEDEETNRLMGNLWGFLVRASDLFGEIAPDLAATFTNKLDELSRQIDCCRLWISDSLYELLQEANETLRIVYDNFNQGVGQSKANALLRVLAGEYQPAVIVQYKENREPLKEWLIGKNAASVPVHTRGSIKRDRSFSSVVVTSWRGRGKFESIIHCHAAPTVICLTYPFEEQWLDQYKNGLNKRVIRQNANPAQRAKIIGCLTSSLEALDSAKTDRADTRPQESTVDPEKYLMSRKKGEAVAELDSDDACDAFYVGFVGLTYAYLLEGRELPVVNRLIQEVLHKSQTIPKRCVHELSIGDYVLFRESGDSDVIRALAQHQMGEAEYDRLRELSSKWKAPLQDLTRKKDLVALAELLGRSVQTVRNWVSNDDLIGPGEEGDIEAIAKLTSDTELSACKKDVFNAIKEVRSAHIQAGRKLTDLLLETLRDRIYEIGDEEKQLELPFGKVWIVEVEQISDQPERRSRGQVNRLFWEPVRAL